MRYFLVREDILPEAVVKTVQVKDLLARGECQTVNEAVERVGLSRSAFYKYKDGIHMLNHLQKESLVTISMDLHHRAGMLSKVLARVAEARGNVLTIHQSIPLQGMANVVITVDTSMLEEEIDRLADALSQLEGVSRAQIIGHG